MAGGSRYKALRLLGEGGFGRVVLADDRELGRRVAIKTLSPRVREVEGILERFSREARVQARIDHPNVLKLYDHDLEAKSPFLVMEFVPGRDLEGVLADEGPMGVEELVDLARQLGAGVDALHRAGVLHRDLKPQNVMLREDRRAVIMDLGLAGVEDMTILTRTGQVLGTPRYMPPEVLRGKPWSEAGDLFQVGAILFRMATGEHLVPGASVEEVARVLKDASWAPFPPGCPLGEEARGVLRRAVDPDPGARFPSGEELAGALARACSPAATPGEAAASSGNAAARSGALAVLAASVPAEPADSPARGSAAKIAAGIAGVVLLVALLPGRAASPPPREVPAAPPPTSTAPAGPVPADLLARVEPELRDLTSRWTDKDCALAAGASPGPGWLAVGAGDLDPACWPALRALLPEVTRVQGWFAAGGRAEALPAEAREVLRAVDARFQARGLPRPFHPFLYVEPASEPVPLVPGPTWAAGVAGTRAATGWFGAAVRAHRRATDFFAASSAEIDRAMRGEASTYPAAALEAAHPGPFLEWKFTGKNPSLHRHAVMEFEPASRVVMDRWLAEGRARFHEMLHATARSIREEPETREAALLAWWGWNLRWAPFYFGHATTRPLPLLLGGEPRSPWEHALAATVFEVRRYVGERYGAGVGSGAPARQREAWEASLDAPGIRPGPWTRGMALHGLARTLVRDLQDVAAAGRFLEERGPEVPALPVSFRVMTTRALAELELEPELRSRVGSGTRAALRALAREVLATLEDEAAPGFVGLELVPELRALAR